MIYYTFHFSKRKENIMNKKYSNKTKEKVIEQYLAGVSVSDLVSKFNVSRTTVYTWTRDHKKKQKHEAVDMKFWLRQSDVMLRIVMLLSMVAVK